MDEGNLMIEQDVLTLEDEEIEQRKCFEAKQVVEEVPSAINYALLGDILLRLGLVEESTRAYEKMLELDPNLFCCHVRIGLAYFHFQDFGKAEHHFLRELEWDPYEPCGNAFLGEARFKLAQRLANDGDGKAALSKLIEAFESFKKAIEQEYPPEYLENYMKLLETSGDWPKETTFDLCLQRLRVPEA